ncbi:MAG TPA: glycoside hydrolase family 172 protein [Fimbriimonadaceae bacterium]|nr:glycoside hydrolase family 172 protein [Fimbriimonadaceae bacterium]
MSQGPLSKIAQIVDARSKRVSSFDRTGGNADHTKIAPGETLVMAEMEGAGIVKHIWITISSRDELHRRNLVLRMYWDGNEHPSVESPLGDFFGQGWGMKYNWASLPLAAAPRDGNALVCYFPMPFGNGARIEVENQGSEEVGAFYYYVDYEEHASIPDDLGRFHAWYNQELTQPESDSGDVENEWAIFGPTPKNPSDANNYLFCDIEGRGHFVGVNYYVNCPTPIWYGEGDDMFCVDGEPWPFSHHGTGTEDYFNQSWSPDEHYLHPYFGTARAPGRGNNSPLFGWLGRTHCYRFHMEDPIRFTRSLRASIEHGHANCLTLEIATVAYWYQTMPHKPFPPLPSAEARRPRPEIPHVEAHKWRESWRQSQGGGFLWGDEKTKA